MKKHKKKAINKSYWYTLTLLPDSNGMDKVNPIFLLLGSRRLIEKPEMHIKLLKAKMNFKETSKENATFLS